MECAETWRVRVGDEGMLMLPKLEYHEVPAPERLVKLSAAEQDALLAHYPAVANL